MTLNIFFSVAIGFIRAISRFLVIKKRYCGQSISIIDENHQNSFSFWMWYGDVIRKIEWIFSIAAKVETK